MAYGMHWEVFIGDILKIVKCLPQIVKEGSSVEVLEEQKLYNESHPDEDGYLALEYGNDPARCLAVVEKTTDTETLEFRTAYPFLKEGIPVALELVDIKQGEDEFEAVIEGISRDGVRISFFDSLYCCNRNAYAKGKKIEFSLAALAYVLEKVEDTNITITEGPSLELERQRRLEEDPDTDVSQINSVDISLAELRALIPLENDMDAEFQTVVEDVDYFAFLDTEICRMSVVFFHQEGQETKIILYASEHVLKGYRPSEGDSIRGVLWLQGYPLRPVEEAESWEDRAGNDSYQENLIKSLAAEEYLSDLHVGTSALAKSVIAAGWDVTTYENPGRSSDIPAFMAEHEGKQVNVWVRSFIIDQEVEAEFTQEEMQRYSEESSQHDQFSAFVFVICKDIGDGYTFKCKGLESLEAFTGKIGMILYRRKLRD